MEEGTPTSSQLDMQGQYRAPSTSSSTSKATVPPWQQRGRKQDSLPGFRRHSMFGTVPEEHKTKIKHSIREEEDEDSEIGYRQEKEGGLGQGNGNQGLRQEGVNCQCRKERSRSSSSGSGEILLHVSKTGAQKNTEDSPECISCAASPRSNSGINSISPGDKLHDSVLDLKSIRKDSSTNLLFGKRKHSSADLNFKGITLVSEESHLEPGTVPVKKELSFVSQEADESDLEQDANDKSKQNTNKCDENGADEKTDKPNSELLPKVNNDLKIGNGANGSMTVEKQERGQVRRVVYKNGQLFINDEKLPILSRSILKLQGLGGSTYGEYSIDLPELPCPQKQYKGRKFKKVEVLEEDFSIDKIRNKSIKRAVMDLFDANTLSRSIAAVKLLSDIANQGLTEVKTLISAQVIPHVIRLMKTHQKDPNLAIHSSKLLRLLATDLDGEQEIFQNGGISIILNCVDLVSKVERKKSIKSSKNYDQLAKITRNRRASMKLPGAIEAQRRNSDPLSEDQPIATITLTGQEAMPSEKRASVSDFSANALSLMNMRSLNMNSYGDSRGSIAEDTQGHPSTLAYKLNLENYTSLSNIGFSQSLSHSRRPSIMPRQDSGEHPSVANSSTVSKAISEFIDSLNIIYSILEIFPTANSDQQEMISDSSKIVLDCAFFLRMINEVFLYKDTEKVTEKIEEQAKALVCCRAAYVYLLDHDAKYVWRKQKRGKSSHTASIDLGVGIEGRCAASGQVVVLPNLSPNDYATKFELHEGKPSSAVCIPMGVKRRKGQVTTTGVLVCFDKIGETEFMSFDLSNLQVLVDVTTLALTRAMDYEGILKYKRQFDVILNTTKKLSSTLELDHLMQVIMSSARNLLQADKCTIFLIDQASQELWTNIYDVDGNMREIRIPLTAGIVGATVALGDTLNIPDAYEDSRFNPNVDKQTGYKTKSILCMPIINIEQQIIGVIQMINKLTRATFNSDDEKLLSAFSSQAAVAIEKSQLFQESIQTQHYLQNILNSIDSTVMTLSGTGELVTMNQNYILDCLGVRTEDAKSLSFGTWLASAPALVEDIKKVYNTGERVMANNYELQSSSGFESNLMINYTLSPLRDSSHKPTGGTYWTQIRNAIHHISMLSFFSKRISDHDEWEKNFIQVYKLSQQWRTKNNNIGIVMVIQDITSETKMMSTLGRYMAPSLVKKVLNDGGAQLGGNRQKVSVFFSDIRSFTKMSESMDPKKLVDLLNLYFECAVDAITKNDGILDKYIGDSVMATFGVPFPSPDDALRACHTALEMSENIEAANKKLAIQNRSAIRYGIGINTGVAVSGNIGCAQRMEYTVIGDSVNLASRIEGATKAYGVKVLISEFTLNERQIADFFITREVDQIRVVGKSRPVRILELVATKTNGVSERELKLINYYSIGLQEFRKQKWDEAIGYFEDCVDIRPDKAAEIMIERCYYLKENPPGDDWDGVCTLETK
eukprot:Nk52_evm76s2118 gene=Nk52_evmTU76s2118